MFKREDDLLPDFDNFYRVGSKLDSLRFVDDVLQAIAYQYQKAHAFSELPRIVIFIDELMKSPDPQDALQAACPMMEYTGMVNWQSLSIVSSSLDPNLLLDQRRSFQRPVEVLPLPGIHSLSKLFPKIEDRMLAFELGGVRLLLPH